MPNMASLTMVMSRRSIDLKWSYSGTAGDSLENKNNMVFSTKDRDNDIWGNNCAV